MDIICFKKNVVKTISLTICLICSPLLNATNITDTTVTDTKINNRNTSHTGVSDANKYNREPVTDAHLEAMVKSETKRLNALFQSSIRNVLIDTDKFGDPQMVVIAQEDAKSQHIQSVIQIESIVSGENRKRQIEEMVAQAKYKQGQISKEQLDHQVLRSVFPVQTTMKPTRLPSRSIVLKQEAIDAITRPIAIIGSDQYSLAWFKTNLGAIRRLKAAIIVTEVKSLTDFQAINSFAPDLMYQPMDASDFLRSIGVHTYPILLTKEGGIQ